MMWAVVKKYYNDEEYKPHHVETVCNCKTGDEAFAMMNYLESQCRDPQLNETVFYDVEEYGS